MNTPSPQKQSDGQREYKCSCGKWFKPNSIPQLRCSECIENDNNPKPPEQSAGLWSVGEYSFKSGHELFVGQKRAGWIFNHEDALEIVNALNKEGGK